MEHGDASKKEPHLIRNHFEWEIFRDAYHAAMQVFAVSKRFPLEERFSLTDQVRRSSRGVSANLAEAWRRRRYKGAFLMRLNDAEAEAAETQTWLAFAVSCDYVKRDDVAEIVSTYDTIIGAIVSTTRNPSPWLLPSADRTLQFAPRPHRPTTRKP